MEDAAILEEPLDVTVADIAEDEIVEEKETEDEGLGLFEGTGLNPDNEEEIRKR